MANLVTMKINDKEVQVEGGQNLIDAAASVGVHIPNLCYLKELKGIGACRMCLVEVEGMKAPMTACTMKAKEGLSIQTETEKVRDIRKFVMDLVVSMHPLDCMTCTKAGQCNLQNYAYDFEIQESTFTRKQFGFGIDDKNPCIKRDPDYCILCGRCVRICKYQGTNVLEFMGRGVGSKVVTAEDKPLHESDCTFCGSCIDVCPVNAILEANRWRKGREWDYEHIKSVCLLCGDACDMTVCTKDGQVRKINAGVLEDPQENYICAYGRFGFDSIGADSRLTAPMKRVNGTLVETTWEDALGIVADRLKKAGGTAGFISTGSLLNEDALTLKRFAADVVKTKNIDTTVSLYADKASLDSGAADLGSADLIVVVDLSPSQWERVLPATDALIRKRVSDGAKLIVINSKDSRVSKAATENLKGDEAAVLAALAKALLGKGLKADKAIEEAVKDSSVTEEIEKAAALYADAKNPVILSSPALYEAAANITLIKGAAVSVPAESNAKGVMFMGLSPEGMAYKAMAEGQAKVLYVIGETLLDKRPEVDFMIVQNSHMTELARQSDIVLPSAAYLEVEGTLVDYLGRLKNVCKAVEPAGAAKSHRQIFAAVAGIMGSDIKETTEDEIKKLVKQDVRVVFRPFKRKEGLDVDMEELVEALNASVIKASRLIWLKELKETVSCAV